MCKMFAHYELIDVTVKYFDYLQGQHLSADCCTCYLSCVLVTNTSS